MVANQLEQEGTANATLADIRDIRDKEKVKMPQDLHQVSLALQRYAVLVHTLFQGPGEPNPFVRRCMWHLASTYHERLPHFLSQHQTLAGTPWGEIYPAHVVRNVQIHVYEYLQALQIGGVRDGDGTIALPSFHELLRDYQRGSFHMSPSWLPRLPASVTMDPAVTLLPLSGEATRWGLARREHRPRPRSPDSRQQPAAGAPARPPRRRVVRT